MYSKLKTILTDCGLCSKRNVRNFFKNNTILVNGAPCTEIDFSVDPEKDKITVNGSTVKNPSYIYLMMNKPAGFVCSTVSDRHPVVYDLIDCAGFADNADGAAKLHTVGRLDSETEGLLLFTTDGVFSHKITDPARHIKKVYRAGLKLAVSEQQQAEYKKAFAEGVVLPAEKKAPESKSLPAEIQWLGADECLVTVTEGQFHQVRRMFLAMKNEVAVLKRLSIGSLKLDEKLAPGQYRTLFSSELSLFQ